MVKLFVEIEVIFVVCRVVVNLTQLLGFPNYMDLRSTTNCYALQERTFEKGGNNKVKDVKKEQKFAAPNGNIEHPQTMRSLGEVKNLKILIHLPNDISRHEMEVDKKINTVESNLDDETDLSKNIDLSEVSSKRVSNPYNSAIEQGQGLNSSDNLEASDIISLDNPIRQTSNLNATDVKAHELNKNDFDPDMSSVDIKPVITLKTLYECHRKRFPNVKISNSNKKFKKTAAICLQELLQLNKQDILDNKKFWNTIDNFWSRLPKMYRKYPDRKNMFHHNKNFFEHEFNILPSDNSNPNRSNQDTIVEENEADPEVSDNEFDLDMSCDEIRPHTSYKSTITSMDNQIRQTSNLVAFRTEKDTKDEHTNLLNSENLSKKCLDGISDTEKINDGMEESMPETSKVESEKLADLRTTFKCLKCKPYPRRTSNFSTKLRLEKHVASFHEGKLGNSYKCKYCSTFYSNKSNLDRHQIRNCTKGVTPIEKQVATPMKLKCSRCKYKSFSTQSELDEHIILVHEGKSKNKFECGHCHKFYSTKANLDKHILRNCPPETKSTSTKPCFITFGSRDVLGDLIIKKPNTEMTGQKIEANNSVGRKAFLFFCFLCACTEKKVNFYFGKTFFYASKSCFY